MHGRPLSWLPTLVCGRCAQAPPTHTRTHICTLSHTHTHGTGRVLYFILLGSGAMPHTRHRRQGLSALTSFNDDFNRAVFFNFVGGLEMK